MCTADEIVRGEHWQRLMEDTRQKRDYDPDTPMPWNAIIKDSAFRIGHGSLQEFWDDHVLHPSTLLPKDRAHYVSQREGYAPPGGSGGRGGEDRKGADVVPSAPHQPSPHPGGAPWAQLAIEDYTAWQPAPDNWTKKEWKGKGHKGAKDKDGKGKGKEGKNKGTYGKGKGGKAAKAAAKAKAKAAALWQAWRSESGK